MIPTTSLLAALRNVQGRSAEDILAEGLLRLTQDTLKVSDALELNYVKGTFEKGLLRQECLFACFR